MPENATHSEVSRLCYQLLVVFRDHLANSPAEAQLRFNYTREQAEALAGMSHEALQKLANEGMMLFTLNVPTAPRLKVV